MLEPQLLLMQTKTAVPITLILLFLAFILLLGTPLPLEQSTLQIGSVAAVKTIGVNVYWDLNKTRQLTNFTWGTLEPDETVNITVFIHNNGNVNATVTVNTTSYQPPTLRQYMTFSTPANNTVLQPDETVETVFTLHIHGDIMGITGFSFNINVIATG